MNSSNPERSELKITKNQVNSLGLPQAEAIHQLERDLDHLEKDSSVKGLMSNIYRQLIGEGGQVKTITREDLVNRLQSKYQVAPVDAALQKLSTLGIIMIDEQGVMKVSSGTLAKLIDKKVQVETAGQQKVETFIDNSYEYYLEKGRLLREQDLNYIDPYLDTLVLKTGQEKFIRESRAAVQMQKRRRSLLIVGTITVLAILAAAAIYFAIRAKEEAYMAREDEEFAMQQKEIADKEASAARIAEGAARKAEANLLLANDSLEEAQNKIQGLYQQVSIEKDEAIMAGRNAERQRLLAEEQSRIATARALEIEKLSKDLQLYANEQAREAEAAREAELISEELRFILLSHNVAKRSLALKEGDKDLKAYTASLAYYINADAEQGDVLHPDIYRSLYYAAKNLGTGTIPEPLDLASGAIGNISCENASSCITCSSDGNVFRFAFNSSGNLSGRQELYHMDHDAPHYVFPTASGTAFVMGAFPFLLEVDLHGGKEVRRFPLLEGQFIRSAVRLDERQLMLQTTDNSVHEFDCDNGEMRTTLDIDDGAIAWTALPHLGLICFANTNNDLILTDRKRNVNVKYASAKKRVSTMLLKQYDEMIYLALAYVDGELEVFISNKDAFLEAYQSQRQGKSFYQIKSFRSSIHTGHIPSLVFAETKPLLAVSSYDGSVSVWDLVQWVKRQGVYQPLILDDHDDWVTSCAFVPGDRALITGTKLGTVKYWDLDPAVYANGMCNRVRRIPNEEEWREYIGDELLSYKDRVCREKE